MHIVIDAPRWRIAELPPMVEPISSVRIEGDAVFCEDSTHPFSASVYEISFVPDRWKGYAFNRQKELMVVC